MRIYTVVSASILLLLGVLSFAFSESFDMPPYIKLLNLVLGVWGMIAVFNKK